MLSLLRREARRVYKRWSRRGTPSPFVDGKIRLHLGCGQHYWPGWVNIDGDRGADSDRVMDFTTIGHRFPSGQVAQIEIIQALSYLPLWQAQEFLRTCHQLLEPGGKLGIEVVNAEACAERIVSERDEREYLEAVRGLYAFTFDMMERRQRFAPYAFGWSPWHLEKELRAAGFSQLEFGPPTVHTGYEWRDIRVVATR